MHILRLMHIHQADYSDIHPYVFSPKGGSPTELEVDHEKILASPFPTFSVEVDDGRLTVDKEGMGFDILCVFCREIKFDSYHFIVLVKAMETEMVFEVFEDRVVAYTDGKVSRDLPDRTMYLSIKSLVNSMLERLHSGKLGVFNASGKAKFKASGTLKKTFKPNGIIYIRDKSQSENFAAKSGRSIDWENTFEVGCHWRRIGGESLGKDRKGNRVVMGATWINSYQKGVGEVLIKVRKVNKV